MRLAPLLLACFATAPLLHAEEPAYLYPQTGAFKQNLAKAQEKGLTLTDYHIHIRGGMTPEKAALRQESSGIRSAVLENFGREWPLSNNVALATFIDASSQARANGRPRPK